MHSHIYRVPDPFRNEVQMQQNLFINVSLYNLTKSEVSPCLQVVVVVGNSLSGQDISMELVDVANQIHLSAKSLDISEGLSKVISKHDSLHLHPQVPLYHPPKFTKT